MKRAKSRRHGGRGGARKAVAAKVAAACVVLSCSLAWADTTPNHVHDVKLRTVEGLAGSTEIVVEGTSPPSYTVRVAEGGKRLYVDIGNADVVGAPGAITTPVGLVGGVLTQGFTTDGGRTTRVSISLSKNAAYRVRADGNLLRIGLTPSATTMAATGPLPVASSVATPGKTAPAVKDVRFDHAVAGSDRVVVSLTSIPSYSMAVSAQGRPRLEMASTTVPEELVRMLDVSAYKGALKSVSTFADPKRGVTIIELDRAGDQQGTLSVEGTSLVWSFPVATTTAAATRPGTPQMGSATTAPQVPHDGRKVTTVAHEYSPGDLPKVETSIHGEDTTTVETTNGAEAGFVSHIAAQQARGRYTGRRINFDVKEADIHNVLRFLADVGHVNIVAADNVQGTITLRMNNVPWDQALDVVLQAKGLGMVRNGNLIRIAPASELQKERELLAAQRKSEFEATPTETRLIPINYAQAGDLLPRAQDLLSPRGSVSVDDRTNIMIARDIPANLDWIEQLVHTLDTQTAQVLIEARIVEATSKYIRDVGIQWGGDATFSEATGNPTGVAFPSRVTAAGGNYDNNTPTAGLSPFQRQIATPNFAVNLPAAVGTGSGGALGLSFGSIDDTLNLGVRLSAAESSGLLRVVSSPRIMTLDNREARINQGTLIPFAQVSALGVQTTFQEAKLQLLVRPHVTADGTVSMHVKISRDEPDFNQTSPRGDPTILKREAETDLLVMDGHTAVIGGIYTRNTGRNLDQVPFFGDIPILGILFQRRRASDTRNELVIFLTPRIVNRSASLVQ
jgi:type IV pilus assembly protein PilQ